MTTTKKNLSEEVRAILAKNPAENAAAICAKVGCTPNLVYVIRNRRNRGRAERASSNRPAAPRRPSPSNAGAAGNVVDMIRRVDSERARMREALRKVGAILDEVVGA